MNESYSYLEQFKKNGFYTSRFSFIRDDIYLVACVDIKTGKQILKIEKVDIDTQEILESSRIDCIHTAICNISIDDFTNLDGDVDAQKKFYDKHLNIQSSEKLREIILSPEEKFIAFRSWVAGISEAGENAFSIQTEIDRNLNQVPIVSFLMKFMAIIDNQYLTDFLFKIERECIFNGIVHESCMIANLDALKDILIIDKSVLFNYVYNPILLSFIIENFPKYLFIHEDVNIRIMIAKNLDAPKKYPNEYKILFDDNDSRVRKEVAKNLNAPELENEYRKLYHDVDKNVRKGVASNKGATIRFPDLHIQLFNKDKEIRRFFAINSAFAQTFPSVFQELFFDENNSVRVSIAENSEAVNFLEYERLFKDKDWLVRANIVKNPKVKDKFPKLYRKLLKDRDSRVKDVISEILSDEKDIREKHRQYEIEININYYKGKGVPLTEYF